MGDQEVVSLPQKVSDHTFEERDRFTAVRACDGGCADLLGRIFEDVLDDEIDDYFARHAALGDYAVVRGADLRSD